MKKQKSKFWLFLFSLWPGAGHMYMGLMRMGLSFMLAFVGLIAVTVITGIDVLSVFPFTLYIYSFFHANNIGGMDAEQFAALEDDYLFGIGEWDVSRFKLDKKNRNIAAVVCIVLGICMLWNVGFDMVRDYVGWDNPVIRNIYYTVQDDVPRIIIAIAIIWFGVSLMRGKKVGFTERDGQADKGRAESSVALIGQKEEERHPDAESAKEQCADMPSAGEQEQSMQGTAEGNAQEKGE